MLRPTFHSKETKKKYHLINVEISNPTNTIPVDMHQNIYSTIIFENKNHNSTNALSCIFFHLFFMLFAIYMNRFLSTKWKLNEFNLFDRIIQRRPWWLDDSKIDNNCNCVWNDQIFCCCCCWRKCLNLVLENC